MRGRWAAERLAAVLATIFLFGHCLEANSPSDGLKAAVTNLPLYFIENRGQRDPSVAYYLEGGDTSVYFADGGITYSLKGPRERFSVKLDFVGASPDARSEGHDRTEAVVSYFKGDRADWKTGLLTYGRLVYEDLWPGIDLVYTGEGGRLKYTFVVWPGADPTAIQLAYRGATNLQVSPEGRLSVSTPSGVLEEDVPYVYQEAADGRVEVEASYELQAVSGETHGFGFRVGPYDVEKPLFLDPLVLAYCGFIGGSGADQGLDIAVDGSGNAYVVGVTSSTEVSAYPGPDATANGANDAFVVKVNAAGTALIYAGYIGGAADDAAYGVAVDGSGNAYLVGVTASSEATFPETVGPDLTYNGGVSDVFVAKLDAAGTTLLYCGYIGGSGLDETLDVAVDGSGNAYVGGSTISTEASFPVTVGPDLTYNGGSRDSFVAKVNAAGTALVYCGYIGGTGWDFTHGIAVDGSGNAYLTGDTTSTEASFPVLVGPDLTQNGSWDVFVTKVNAAGTGLVYSGFIGGSGDDLRARVAVDGSGNAYVVGVTASTEATFPDTVGPDLTYNGGTWDGFVAKVNAAGTGLIYAGYIGGSGEDRVRAVALDSSNNAVVSGWTASTEATFPVTAGPDSTYNGGIYDAFVARVNAAGTALLECGYIGGSAEDQAPGVAVDGADNVYVTGFTISTQATFPELVGPFLTYMGGATDGFVAKMNAVTTAVELTSFEAVALDSAVELRWTTGSELSNLGFHLYRSSSAEGPYERITLRLTPGLGSSPAGATYRYRDEGLSNGATYFYRLEDVETTGRTEMHGPVTAAPAEGNSAGDASSVAASAFLTYGDPEATSLRVLERGARRLVLELRVGGFSAEPLDDGTVRISILGFSEASEAGSPSIPVKRSWVEIESGRTVRVVSVAAEGVEEFSSLRPAPGEEPEMVASRRGTVRAGRRTRGESEALGIAAFYPEEPAKVLSVGYQEETRKALLELAPLRWERAGERLLLARTLRVELLFEGREETRHRESSSHNRRDVIGRFGVRDRGLYALSFEQATGGYRRRAIPASSLRLSRLGKAVAFHLEPDLSVFRPGSTLYFFSEGESLNPYERRAVYELELNGGGRRMPVVSASPSGSPVPFYEQRLEREENRYYQAGLLEAPDLWLWDALLAPITGCYPFVLSRLVSSEPAEIEIRLQGVSNLPESPDHHLRVSVNGALVAEVTLEGKKALRLTAEIPAFVLREGENVLEVESLGDSGAAYSMVMLDGFSVRYPRAPIADGGTLEGRFRESGVAEVSGLPDGARVVDISEETPRWLRGVESAAGRVRFRSEADRSYLLVSPRAVLKPEALTPVSSLLKKDKHQTDHLVIGPKEFLEVARPLIARRRQQGLRSRGVSLEQIYSEFGFGEKRPEAVREFIAYAYHHWRKPSPRYVLLLGDASYDFKDYLGTGVKNQLPPLAVKTSYLWTASDPAYAAVNGEDILPDLAIGRLPAADSEELRAMIDKTLVYESSSPLSSGPIVLVADDPDAAGDFEADAEEISSSLLASRLPRKIYLARLGTEATRGEIADAFDEGASLLSYLGHGGIHLWATENVFDTSRVAGLRGQSRQPLVLTLNCLNGYFHFPYFNSLAEELVKAEGKGAIAAVSPSGLSLNDPAHLFHKALLGELLSGSHVRLGDALSAAQAAYAENGAFPELVSIYHLFGDPALNIR